MVFVFEYNYNCSCNNIMKKKFQYWSIGISYSCFPIVGVTGTGYVYGYIKKYHNLEIQRMSFRRLKIYILTYRV